MRASGIWKGSISFGLLNIPVSVQSAKEGKELHFSMLDQRNMAPVKFKRVNAETGREVPYKEIVKAYEYKDGEYVTLTKEDFRAANVKATQTIDIEDFVAMDDIDPLMFEKPYYLVPQKDGEKGYFLLQRALANTQRIAIAKIVIRTKQHLAAIIPRGDYLVLEQLRFAHEVKEIHEAEYLKEMVKAKPKFTPKELKMAETLIEEMTVDWEPEHYKDTYYDDLMKRIRQKVKAGEGKELEAPEVDEEEVSPSKVVDLLPLLQKSLESKGHKKTRSSKSRSHAH